MISVAPRVGAWIETYIKHEVWGKHVVAPRVGAWIETCGQSRLFYPAPSRPAWARGLKPPHVLASAGRKASRPAWARGLKLWPVAGNNARGQVAPRVGAWIETRSRMFQRPAGGVAPRVGAWIETFNVGIRQIGQSRRAPRGRVD